MRVASLVEDKKFDMLIGCIILANSIVLVLETDHRADCEDPESKKCSQDMITYTILGNSFLFVYITELALKLYAYRMSFIQSSWNNFDFVIVVTSVLSEVLGGTIPAISVARVFRAVRLAKVFRVLMVYKELYLIIFGFTSAMRAICWASLLLFFLITIWSIFAVELLHPVNKELAKEGVYDECARCPRAFESVMSSNLTFLQTIISGDSWGIYAVPIIERNPFLVLVFLGVWSTVVLGFSNLILAVIVDCAADARKDDLEYQERVQLLGEEAAMQKFLKLCSELDTDGSGELSYNEFEMAYESCGELSQMLKVMNIERADLPMLFEIMDEDQNGDIGYAEFAQSIHKMRSSEAYLNFTFIKHEIREVKEATLKELKQFKSEVKADIANLVDLVSRGSSDRGKQVPGMVSVEPCSDEDNPNIVQVQEKATPTTFTGAGAAADKPPFQDELMVKLEEIVESMKLLVSKTFQPPSSRECDAQQEKLLSLPRSHSPPTGTISVALQEPKDYSRSRLPEPPATGRIPEIQMPFASSVCSACTLSPATRIERIDLASPPS